MHISKLLADLKTSYSRDFEVNNLVDSSKNIASGDTFLAIGNGEKFIADAIKNGAASVIVDSGCKDSYPNYDIAKVDNLQSNLPKILDVFYSFKQKAPKVKLFGVTGTNGKSSVCHYFNQIIKSLDLKVGNIGTLGVGDIDNMEPSPLTTPSIISVYNSIQSLADNGTQYIGMEVSSHALDQDRISGIDFEAVAFTNLTQDHLDYHMTMDNYFNAKARLFINYRSKFKIINIDDQYGEKLYGLCKKDFENTFSITIKDKPADVSCKIQSQDQFSTYFNLQTPWGNFSNIKTNIIGDFNIANLITAVASAHVVLQDKKINFETLLDTIKDLKPVPGRFNLINKNVDKPLVIVDFAHTPNALLNILLAIKSNFNKNIITVFGCGGERDKGKRPIMTEIALKHSSKVIITEDNPRSEPVDNIIQDMIAEIKNTPAFSNLIIEPSRKKSIYLAIEMAKNDEIVLIAGKGHETDLIVGEERIHFVDSEVAKQALVDIWK